MTLTRSILLFAAAALFEIGGAWLVWQGIREHKGWIWIGAGVVALGLYGFFATLQPDANFGRILAAYGGVFVAGSYQAQIVDRVLAETSPDDRVLVHGAETWILAASQRLSPTAITYSLPVEQGYGGLPEQYLADVTAFPPALIVESPVSCGISIACPAEKDHFAGLAPWVASSYRLEGDVVGFRFWRSVPS